MASTSGGGDGWSPSRMDVRFCIHASDGAGGWYLRSKAIPYVTYRVQRAGNIVGPWTDLGTLTAPANGSIEFHDSAPTPTDQSFYRLVQP